MVFDYGDVGKDFFVILDGQVSILVPLAVEVEFKPSNADHSKIRAPTPGQASISSKEIN